MPYQENITVFSEDSVPNFVKSGNRCGHNPAIPRGEYHRPDLKKSLPSVMLSLIKGLKKYFHDPSLIPTLAYLYGSYNKDGSLSWNRSESRDGELDILTAIISYTDFSCYKVGTPCDNGDFIYRSHEEIARCCKMLEDDDRTPNSRYYRLIRNITKAGIITVHKQYVTIFNGTKYVKRAKTAIKSINPDWLLSLGILSSKKLEAFRIRCIEDLKIKQNRSYRRNPTTKDAQEAKERFHATMVKKSAKETLKGKIFPKKESIQERNKKDQESKDYLRDFTTIHELLVNAGKSPSEARIETHRQLGSVSDYIKQNI